MAIARLLKEMEPEHDWEATLARIARARILGLVAEAEALYVKEVTSK
jgi:hypothetical protein